MQYANDIHLLCICIGNGKHNNFCEILQENFSQQKYLCFTENAIKCGKVYYNRLSYTLLDKKASISVILGIGDPSPNF